MTTARKTSKAKKAKANGAETVETVLTNGTESVKEGFEKLAEGYEQAVVFNKETAEAVIASASKANEGAETINGEVFSYTRQAVEDGIAVTQTMLAATSFQEALEVQSQFAKTSFEAYVTEMSKVRELALDTAKTASEPLQARANAFAALVQNQAV